MSSIKRLARFSRRWWYVSMTCMAINSHVATVRAEPTGDAAPAGAPAKPPPPPPYSLPWQLRPAAVGNVVRSDTAIAFYENPMSGESGVTAASMLLGSYKLTPEFAPMVRLGVVSNDPPDGARTAGGANIDGAAVFINPVIGGTYLFKLSPEFRLAAFLGVALPLGGGGGDSPDPSSAAANAAGILARSAMDNAMFAVDYLTIFPGFDLAYVAHGLTVQLEATLLQLFRVRANEQVQPDDARTNFTAGLHVGYFLVPQLSLGAELRHQRWLSTPAAVEADTTDTLRDNTTFAIGVRFHIKLSDTAWLRPGVAYATGLDDPMKLRKYQILQIDVPVAF
jgi:hypothetical protein